MLTDADIRAAGFVWFNHSNGRTRYVRPEGNAEAVLFEDGTAVAYTVAYSATDDLPDGCGDDRPVNTAVDLAAFVSTLGTGGSA